MFERFSRTPKMRGPRFDKHGKMIGLIIRSAEPVRFAHTNTYLPFSPQQQDIPPSTESTETPVSIYDQYPELLDSSKLKNPPPSLPEDQTQE